MVSRLDMALQPSRTGATVGSGNANAMYNDLSALKGLNKGENSPEKLRAVAQQFESIFVKMMLDSMRDANAVFGEDNLFNSKDTEFYQDMLDNQTALNLSKGKGVGLADVIYRQLSQYNATPGRVDHIDQDGLQRASKSISMPAVVTPSPTANSNKKTNEPLTFESPEQFIDHLQPIAKKVGAAMGVDPQALLAQAALETGWGKYVNSDEAGRSSFNLFNIKADQRWDGDKVTVSTLEYRGGVAMREKANFRAYESYEQSFADYLDFIKNSPRYQQALEQGDNATEYARELQSAGYATDPNYADKIGKILTSNVFTRTRGV